MAYINKVTVRGKTYNLENLTDGSYVVRLPKLSADDEFVTKNTLQDGISASELTNGTYTVSLPNNLTKMIRLLYKVYKMKLIIIKSIR